MIHNARDLSATEKTVLEGLLGRPIEEDESISVRPASLPPAPEWLLRSWKSAKDLGVSEVSDEEIEREVMQMRTDVSGKPANQPA